MTETAPAALIFETPAESIVAGDLITVADRPVIVTGDARPYRDYGRSLVRVDGRGMWDDVLTTVDYAPGQAVEILRLP